MLAVRGLQALCRIYRFEIANELEEKKEAQMGTSKAKWTADGCCGCGVWYDGVICEVCHDCLSQA